MKAVKEKMLLTTKPQDDGFYMPAEFEPHQATVLVWPVRPGSWGTDPSPSQRAFLKVIGKISESETVYLLADADHREEAEQAVRTMNVQVLEIANDDAWARDTAPTFVVNKSGELRGVSWRFNAWGGLVDGLYADWDQDDKLAGSLCEKLEVPCYDASPFVLEGGSIHSDGEGTLMVTETCLLSAGRNPQLSKEQIEQVLKDYTGCQKILWLPYGIYNDETNEHVDNVCAFISPGEVVLAWTDNTEDPQYPMSKACLEYLEQVTDAQGRKLKIHKLPISDVPICCSEEDCGEYLFEPGEDTREPGEHLAASYVNFYIANGAVLVPQFGGENAESDRRALDILRPLFPGREVVGIDARAILMGGGNIHCITQQIPGVKCLKQGGPA